MSTMRRTSALVWRKSRACARHPRRGLSTAASAPSVEITALPNRLRVATENGPGHFSCLGLYVDAGARYEVPSTSGVSHFLDRMAFKVCLFFPLQCGLTSSEAHAEYIDTVI